jgi:amidase
LDCNDICKGSTLYLPVFTEGGLLAIGDLHALMGDGEIGECGLEIGGMVTIRVTVLKGKHIAAPILETEDFIEIIGLGSTLEEASQNASRHMLDYMIQELNMSENDAAIRLCLCGNLKICQHVNSVKTVAMRIDKGMIHVNGS